MKKKKAAKMFGASALGFSVFMGLAWPFFNIMVACKKRESQTKRAWLGLSHVKNNNPRKEYGSEYEAGREWCSRQKLKDCYIRSADGLVLHASYLPAERPVRTVLLSHGYKGNWIGDFAGVAAFLHENGCNLLMIDQRCCGRSKGEYITFGAMERYDVQRWTHYLAEHNPNRLPIYLYGESLGAASVLMASGLRLPDDVKGIISDCGFRSMRGQIQDMAANWFHVKWVGLLLWRINLYCRLFANFGMEDADAVSALKTNTRPVLFFHGEKDTFVYPRNAEVLYAACKAPKELVLVPEARHLCSVYAAPELYRQKLLEFFRTND